MATTTPPPTTPPPPSTRRRATRKKSNTPVIAAVAVIVVIVLLVVIGFASCGGSDKTPAAGSPGAVKSSATLLGKALTEIQSGDLAKAESDLNQAAELNPKNKYAFYNLGYIAQSKSNNAGAEAQYKHALAIDPKFGAALYNLAILRVADSDVPGAITLYRKAIASSPNDANAHFNLGLLLRQTGKTAEGTQQVQTAVRLAPSLAAAASAQGVPSAAR